jgi:hypothetical protein
VYCTYAVAQSSGAEVLYYATNDSESQRGAIIPIVDRIVPGAPFQSCIEDLVAGRGWGKIVTRLVDWLNNVQHPLSNEARTEVPILGQYL